jgi:hypothetical protein
MFFQFSKAIENCYSNPFFISVIGMEFLFFWFGSCEKKVFVTIWLMKERNVTRWRCAWFLFRFFTFVIWQAWTFFHMIYCERYKKYVTNPGILFRALPSTAFVVTPRKVLLVCLKLVSLFSFTDGLGAFKRQVVTREYSQLIEWVDT